MADCPDMPPLEDDKNMICSTSNQSSNSISIPISCINNGASTSGECNYSSDEDIDDEEDDTEWIEENGENSIGLVDCLCLFCSSSYNTIVPLLEHMESSHSFYMKVVITNWCIDQTSYIKFINYTRLEKPTVKFMLTTSPKIFANERYMKPVLPGDPLLMYDIEEAYEEYEESEEDEENLKDTCNELKEIVQKQREALRRLMEEAHGGRELKSVKTVSDLDVDEDEGYFNSYAYFDIHHEMLNDKVRTDSYRDAILKNAPLFNGKQVLDLGCGTGILSMFAAQAGGKIFAVDMSEVIFHAMQIVKENNLDKAITLKKGRLEDLNFSNKFDVIVSEWMGYFLLFEGMLDSVIYARNHYLSPTGVLLPNRCTLHIIGVEDLVSYKKFIQFWGDVYGFKMTCMVTEVIKEASTEVVKKECICTSSSVIADFDLMTVCAADTEFTSEFSLTSERDADLTCFVGYFDTYFNLPEAVFFSTGPHADPTHWKQTIFYLPSIRKIKKDEVLNGSITVRRKRKEIRSLDVSITFDNKKFNYFVE